MKNTQKLGFILLVGTLAVAGLATEALADSDEPTPSDEGSAAAGDEVATEASGGTIQGIVQARRARYVPNTVVYLEEVAGEFAPAAEPVHMDQLNQQFVPFALPVVRGTTVRYLNNDATGHNVFTPDGEGFDLGTWDQGATRDHTFAELGVYTQLCQLHPSMVAYVLVLQNPYFAVVGGEDGAFRIDDVPPGTYTLTVWNERKEAEAQTVTVSSGGTVDLTVQLQ